MNRDIVSSIESEYHRYKSLGEAAFGQLTVGELADASGSDNSVAVIVWHVSGNLESRFTDFLTTDGEKPWRDRESEFRARVGVSQAEVAGKWDKGWDVLIAALAPLGDEDLTDEVSIRSIGLTVHEALHRSLAHASYHVGQIVYLSKRLRGSSWQYLSIPPGGSAAYNRNPSFEKAPDNVTEVTSQDAEE